MVLYISGKKSKTIIKNCLLLLQSSTLLYDPISVKLCMNIYNSISGELNFFLLYISIVSFLKIMIINILRIGFFGRDGEVGYRIYLLLQDTCSVWKVSD